MRLYPEMTVSLWLRDLAPVFSGDTIDLNTVTVTFALSNSDNAVVIAADNAVPIGTAFRRVITLPVTPGRYKALARATNGTSVYRSVTELQILPAPDEA